MSSAQPCPRCGGPIPDAGPGPVCPRCGPPPTLTFAPTGDGPPPTLSLPPGPVADPPPTLSLPQFLVRPSVASDAPTATAPPAGPDLPASRVGRFEFREKLGEGAFG